MSFSRATHLNLSANFAKIGDDIFLQNEWLDILSYTGYAAGYGFDTVFGPIELKYNWSPDTNYSAYLISVGYWFLVTLYLNRLFSRFLFIVWNNNCKFVNKSSSTLKNYSFHS